MHTGVPEQICIEPMKHIFLARKKVLRATALLFLMLSVPIMAQMEQAEMPRILILTTGGTIASTASAPMIEGPALVRAVPQLLDHARIEVEEFSRVGSSEITPTHWLKLAQLVNSRFAQDEAITGIVITHGTDTMEETAYFLNLTVKYDKPVVLVGSMRSADEISADGPANLLNAVRVAASGDAAGQGVLVVLNEDIASARNVRKTDNRRVHTFRSPNLGFVGTVDPDSIRFYQKTLLPHTTQTEFDVSNLQELPSVAVLNDATGIDAELVYHFGQFNLDGMVVRTFAGGRMSEGMLQGLERLGSSGIPTVITSRVPNGRIVTPPEYSFPAIVASDQPDNKARILLMLALTVTRDHEELQRIFATY